MLGDLVFDIPRQNFWVTENGYAWDLEELVQAITSNGGVMLNPLSQQMFTTNDIRAIVQHPLGKDLATMAIEQKKLKLGVRPKTIEQLDKLILLGQLHENSSTLRLPTQHVGNNKLLCFLRNKHSHNWQRSINTTAAEIRPFIVGSTPSLDPSFPWDTLRQPTDIYLSKRKKETAGQTEARLIQFIKFSGDIIDIAIAACGYKLAWHALKDLLSGELNVGADYEVPLSTYLQAIVAENHVNPFAVSGVEAQRATALIDLIPCLYCLHEETEHRSMTIYQPSYRDETDK